MKQTNDEHEVPFEMNIGLGNSPCECEESYGKCGNCKIVARFAMKLSKSKHKDRVDKYTGYGRLTSEDIFSYFLNEVNKPKYQRNTSNWLYYIFFDHFMLFYLYNDCIIEKKELDKLIKEGKAERCGSRMHQGDLLKSWKLIKPAKTTRLKTRFLIFKRDNYSCQICGRNAQDGVKLELDHIIPKFKNGTNDINNYQTLCKECNIGKGVMDI